MKKIFSFVLFPPVLLLILLNTIPSVFMTQLVFDNAPEVYLPKELPSVVLKEKLSKLYPGDQIAMILFKGDKLYTDDFLNKLEQAAKEIKQHPKVDRVINVTEMEHIEGNEEGFEASSLLGKERRKTLKDPSKRYLFAIKDRIASDLIVSSTNDQLMLMVVRPNKMDSTMDRIDLLETVYEVLAKHRIDSLVYAQAGPIINEIEQFDAMIRDIVLLVPGTMIIGLLLIWFMFKRALAVLVAGLLTGAVVNATMLIFVVFSVPYTMISGMLAPLLSALTTAFLIHFYSYLKQASSYQYEAKQRVAFAVKQVKKPAFYTALTTVLGLASMSVSPILPIGHFGLMSGFGVSILFVLLIWIVPPIFVRFDHSPWPSVKQQSGFIDSFIKFAVIVSIRHAGKIIALSTLLFVLGIPWIFKVTAETNMLKFFPENHPVTINTHLIQNELSGVMPLEIVLTAAERDDFKRVDNLKQIEKLESWLIQQPEIDKVSSLIGFMKDMHKGMNLNDSAFDVLPEQDIIISQYLFIYDGDEVYELVNRDFSQTRVLLSLNIHNSSKIRALLERINQYMDKTLTGLQSDISGDAKLFADQDELLIKGQLYSLIIAALLIFIVMLLLFRNLSEAILSMLLNLSPILVIFIIMGIFGIWLDMATAMIASVAIGIAVDDTVHLMYGYKKRLAKGNSLVYSLVQSHYKTGRAVIVTTFILCAQFLLVASSSFIPTSHFGLLTAIGLFMALLFDLFLMPALVITFYHRKKRCDRNV